MRMMRRATLRKVLLVPGYQCNNRCVFCVNSGKRGLAARRTAELLRELREAAGRGCDYLEFSGGENTIRPDFARLVGRARELGFKRIAVATNGRMFSYPDFARRACAGGLTDIIFSIHGRDAAHHDALTRVSGSFEQLLAGMDNVRKYFKGTVATNTAVTRKNFRLLPEIGEFIAGFGLYNSEFIYADPNRGGVKRDFRGLMPRISECAPYIRSCLDIAKGWIGEDGPAVLGRNWSVRYAPLCYFREYHPRQISEAREAVIYENVQHVAPDYVDLDATKGRRELGRAKPSKCRGCALDPDCEGIWKEYLRVYGAAELRPVARR